MNDDPDILWRRIRDVERHAPANRPRLLVVEGDAETRLRVQYLLRREVRSDGATTAAEALRMAHAMQYDGLLLGRQLPDDTGRQVMERLRARSAYQGTPIVALFDPAQSGDCESLLAAGFDACVTRPPQREELMAVLPRLLDEGTDADERPRPSGDGVPARTDAEAALPAVSAA